MGAIDILKYYLRMAREQWLDRDSFDTLAKQRLNTAIRSARQTSHYRNLLDSCGNHFSSLPITTKDMIRKDPASFLPYGASKENLYEVRTSGSTGTPLTILIDRDTNDYRVAKEYFIECLHGRSPFELFAHFTAIPDETHVLLTRSGLFRKLPLSPFVEDEKNLAALRESGARMLRSFPSALTTMARLNLDNPVKLKAIISTGEMLEAQSRKLIEDSFSCPVLDIYGLMEFRTVAYQCSEEKRFHVDCSSFILEIVDKHGIPKKNGRGEIVVTSLHSTPMPFLRYATGDIGRWGKECSCGRGSPVIESIEGRKTDVFILPSGRPRPFGALYMALNRIMVKSFQVIQERRDLFVFKYVPLGKDLPASDKQAIEKKILDACLGEKITVEFEQVDSIARTGRGKHRYVISKVGNAHASESESSGNPSRWKKSSETEGRDLNWLASKVSRRRSILDGGEPS
ncbi:MAG: hypothetical protein V1861_04645 [Candidatus Micrarchaeota archaeon]